MAYTTTYPLLVAELQSWLEDDDPDYQAALPTIIGRACDRLQRDLGLALFDETETDTLAAAASSLARPSGCLAVRYLFFPDALDFARERTLAYCKMRGGSGTPEYYHEDSETTIFLAPANATEQTVEIRYLKRLPVLSDANPTNWLTDNVADLLFHAACVESERFLKDANVANQALEDYGQKLSASRVELDDLMAHDHVLAAQ